MARGGRRQGKPATAYANRSDLNGPKKLPVTTAPGQAYGEAKQQAAAQAAVPEASGPLGGPDLGSAMASAQASSPPPVIPISAPTNNPAEPVTATPPPPTTTDPLLSGVALLNTLGDTASPEVKALRAQVTAIQSNAAAP